MKTVAEVIEDALALPLTDRSYITSKLIESLEEENQLSPEALTAYDARVARREAGETKVSTSTELDAKVEAILTR